MARMSVDDKFLRDPRVKAMAAQLGVHPRYMRGWLLEVFAVCYDLETDVLTPALIDQAADREGFADLLFANDLASTARHGLRIRGAGKRIKYLTEKSDAGRIGGVKSGESRRNSAEAKRRSKREADPGSKGQANANLPDPVLPPDPVPEDQRSPSACAIPQVVQEQQHHAGGAGAAAPAVPAVSTPAPVREDIAGTHEAKRPAQTENGQNRPVRPAAVETTLRASRAASPMAFDPNDPRAIGRLAEAIYRRVSDARIAIAAEVKLPAPLPFPPITPATRTRGFGELSARIREEGALAPAACDRVVENAVKQARAKRSIDWLGERLFGDKAWGNARDGIDPSARPQPPRRGDPLPPAPAPKRPDPPPRDPVRSPEDIAAMLAQAAAAAVAPERGKEIAALPTAELVKLYGDGQRAPPASASPDAKKPATTDEKRKAAT